MGKIINTGLLVALFTMGVSMMSLRQVHASEGAGDWKFVAAPYLWAMSIDGDVSLGSRTAEFSIDFVDDILSELDFAALGHLEVQKGRWGFFFDNIYSDISAKGQTPLGEVKLDNSLFVMEIGAIWQVTEWLSNTPQKPSGVFELVGGVRYWDIENEISFSSNEKRERAADWTDPFVGARMLIPLSERFVLTVRSDVGGFGAGSDFSWNVVGLFGYEFTEMISAWAGYRAVGVEFEEGEGINRYEIDATFHGPILGAMFRF
jgi:hypothetical protein